MPGVKTRQMYLGRGILQTSDDILGRQGLNERVKSLLALLEFFNLSSLP
jgi:hypothetical protein